MRERKYTLKEIPPGSKSFVLMDNETKIGCGGQEVLVSLGYVPRGLSDGDQVLVQVTITRLRPATEYVEVQ